MAKVSLRVYNREIESMIETGQLDEAIAHCQHILKVFPMHVETYRLLGKTFLEAKRYADAADIFQRVLSAIPDDFVAQVGMSIIRDDEGKLDDAIWHMARAFEIQPSNTAIQGELRRLYGRRDGSEPAKIRLSRDALANMYAQGELYSQAIAEIRTVLADDPERPDLQVMLARAYYRSGQKVEAAEMAATLLKKYPYCMDALRILVDVLPGTARAENSQIYNTRLQMIDPYQAFTTETAFAVDKVGDAAVDLERLDYRPGALPGAPQPDWASSLGIKLEGEKRGETRPEWLQVPEGEETPMELVPASDEAEKAISPAPSEEAIPDWMKNAGWAPASGEPQIETTTPAEYQPGEPIAKADIPNWLQSMAPESASPAGMVSDEAAARLPAVPEGLPEWQKTQAPDVTADSKSSEEKPDEAAGGGKDIPDWLKSMAPSDEAVTTKTDASINLTEPPSAGGADVPDWLKPVVKGDASVPSIEKIADLPSGSQLVEEGNVPDWLQSVAPEDASKPATIPETEGMVGFQPESEESVPDWLKSMVPGGASEEVARLDVEKPSESQIIDESIPDWMKSMMPPAVSGLAEEPAVEQPGVEFGLPSSTRPEETAESQPSETNDLQDWLSSMELQEASNQPDKNVPAKIVEQPPAEMNDVPEWLKSPTLEEASEMATEKDVKAGIVQPPSGDFIPSWSVPPGPQEPTNAVGDVSSFLAEEVTMKPSEPGSTPAEEMLPDDGGLPDWLKNLNPEASPEAGSLLVEDGDGQPVPPDTGAQFIDTQPMSLDNALPEQPSHSEPVLPASEQPTPPIPEPVAEPDLSTGPVTPLGIGDDAFAWLESLAAKQGAKPEELLTTPEQRTDEMPDYLRQPSVQDESITAPNVQLPLRPPVEINPPEPVSAQEEPPSFVAEVTPEFSGVAETSIPEAAQTIPQTDLVDDQLAEQKPGFDASVGVPEESTQPPSDLIPEIPAEYDAGSTPKQGYSGSSELPTEEPTITSWLSKKDVEEALAEKTAEETVMAQSNEPTEELPDWLKDLEEPVHKPEPPKANEDLPDWLRTPVPPAASEPVPSIQEQVVKPDAEMPAWMDENAPVSRGATPTSPEEWIPAEPGQTESIEVKPAVEPELESKLIQETEPATEQIPLAQTSPLTGTEKAAEIAQGSLNQSEGVGVAAPEIVLKQPSSPTAVPTRDKDTEILSSAQTTLGQNSLSEAMVQYSKLIKRGHLLDEVVHDLREATYRHPVDVIVWQTLGDAYMRANRLQDALDAYTKAEELLR
jgi:cytochrome c-type biogenesis protein CcmH/NrfG